MIGVDVGGTRVKIAEVDGPRVLRSSSVDTQSGRPPAAVLDTIGDLVRTFAPSLPELGVAIPGEVDARGVCFRLPNIPGFEGVAIADELERRTGARITVENDASTATYGELRFGRGRSYPSFLMVTLGTGIGGGLVLGGKLVRGAHGFAGEIGHITVDSSAGAPRCACGNFGCIEAFAGTVALLGRFHAEGGTGEDIATVAGSARLGERAGLAAFDMMTDALAIGLNSIQNLLDLDAIVFSGGVSRSLDLIEPVLREKMRRRAFAKPLGEVPLLESELGDQAGVVGAAHLPELRA